MTTTAAHPRPVCWPPRDLYDPPEAVTPPTWCNRFETWTAGFGVGGRSAALAARPHRRLRGRTVSSPRSVSQNPSASGVERRLQPRPVPGRSPAPEAGVGARLANPGRHRITAFMISALTGLRHRVSEPYADSSCCSS